MKVKVDNYNITEFAVDIACLTCGSIITLNESGDFYTE